MQPDLSRAYVDSEGVEWVVREIASPRLTGKLAEILEEDRRRGGWLVFESGEGEKRRVVERRQRGATRAAYSG